MRTKWACSTGSGASTWPFGAEDYATTPISERTQIHDHEFRFTKSRLDGGVEQSLRLLEFGRLIANTRR